jgi:signal transduction histidine kinase
VGRSFTNPVVEADTVAKLRERPGARRHARNVSLKLTLIYVGFCSGYILISSRLVSEWAVGVEQLSRLEQYKGLAFILATGLLFHFFAQRLLLRLQLQELELVQRERALADAHRRALAATLASSIAHDVKNMLGVLTSGVELLGNSADPGHREVVSWMEKSIDELNSLVRRLMILGNEGLGAEFERVDLLETVRLAVEFAMTHHRIRACDIRVSGEGGIVLPVMPRRIGTMTLNLLLNAAEAMPGGGRIDVVVARTEGGGAVVEYHDAGPGVPAEVAPRLFKPFMTTKPDGTGLGLLAVSQTAEEHGGRLTYERSPRLGGACFRVTLGERPRGA